MGSQSFQSIKEIDKTEETAYDFYNQYALLNGFGTRKHNAHKISTTGAIFRRQFVCNKEGFKRVDDKKPNVNKKRRRDLRTGCEAMTQVTLSKKLGVWIVDKFQDVHNHPLTTTTSKVIKHRSHSKYHRTNICKSLVSDLNHEGLKASQITRVVNVIKPSEEVDITPRQCSSIIRIERKNNVGKECYGIIKYFQEKATWVDLNDKYDLKENWWIQNMYNIHAHWAKPFLKDTFFPSMTTSGRSESIHSFFDGMSSLSSSSSSKSPLENEYNSRLSQLGTSTSRSMVGTSNPQPSTSLLRRDELGGIKDKAEKKHDEEIWFTANEEE
ncbi:hypothetical protein RJ639_008040 [Escallonia herrerae]|uniref:FAR1 domain-containing protein n=1 Tax=Escallonia herrerae TaxID=1293975 RepID=A0AA88VRK6_9ASTE|nr:hypothetical protein RJ639_008040 [Escallonia herrerae]